MIAIGVLAVWRSRTTERPAVVALAVLPFLNLGHDADRDYLAAGLTDETSASLARMNPRTSR